jgi:uncharacterized membrane protein (UPF0136 family)
MIGCVSDGQTVSILAGAAGSDKAAAATLLQHTQTSNIIYASFCIISHIQLYYNDGLLHGYTIR